MDELDVFLSTLYEGQTGWVYSPIKHRDSDPNTAWAQKFFYWPNEKIALQDWILVRREDADVYIAPALFKEKAVKKEQVKGAQVVWAEVDGHANLDLSKLPAPSMTIQSSTDDHVHLYWKIPFMPGGAVEEINRRVTYGLGADSSGWDMTQVLRPPNTFNHKYDPILQTKLKHVNVIASPLDPHVFDVYPEPPKFVPLSDIAALPSLDSVLNKHKGLPKKVEALRNVVPEVTTRSSHLTYVSLLLAENGWTHEEIVVFLMDEDQKVGKFVGRSDYLIRYSTLASHAIRKVEGEQLLSFLTPSQFLELEIDFTSLWGKYLHARGNCLLGGSPGVGKTQLALQLAFAIGLGKDCIGGTTDPGKVAFFSYEMPQEGLKWLLVQQLPWYSPQERELLDQNVLITAPGFAAPIAEMEKAIETIEPRCFFIDSLSTLSEKSLAEEETAKAILAWDKKFRATQGLASFFVHHAKKESWDRPPKLSDIFGSYLFSAWFDSVLCLWKQVKEKPGKDTQQIITHHLVELKTRFGQETIFEIARTENLTWIPKEKKEDVKPTGPISKEVENPQQSFKKDDI